MLIFLIVAGFLQLSLDEEPVLVESAFDRAHRPFSAHPQLLAHHPDETLVVGYQHHTSLLH